MATFTSPSTVRNFCALFDSGELEVLLQHTKVAVIGPVTAKAAEEESLRVDIVAESSTVESLVDTIVRVLASPGRTTPSEKLHEQ